LEQGLNHWIEVSDAEALRKVRTVQRASAGERSDSVSAYLWQPPANASTAYTPNALNQYASVGGVAYSYDGNGNLTGDGVTAYAYDAENRLLSATKTGVAAVYAYDPLGRRTRKSGAGVTPAFFVSSGSDEIAEYDGTGALAVRYVPGPAIDQPIAMVTAAGAKSYFHTNRQGSVIAMSGSGAVLSEGPYTYDPYGNCFAGAVACSAGEPYRFTGRRLDAETGLYYYRARYYSAAVGRFLQTDPVGYSAGLNLYAYVGNDPTDKSDPTGECEPVCGAIVGGAIGGAFGFASYLLTAEDPTIGGAIASTGEGAVVGAVAGSGIGLVGLAVAGGSAHVVAKALTSVSNGDVISDHSRYGQTTTDEVKTVGKDFVVGAVDAVAGKKMVDRLAPGASKFAKHAIKSLKTKMTRGAIYSASKQVGEVLANGVYEGGKIIGDAISSALKSSCDADGNKSPCTK